MRSPRPEPVLECVESLPRLAVARTLRQHPEWSLEDLFRVIAGGGPRAAILGELTVAELLSIDVSDAVPGIDRIRLRRALRVDGVEFDQLVFEVLCQAPGDVGHGYLVDRLGGPRWKLLGSLGRLVAAGKVMRSGKTSATRYCAVKIRA